MYARLKPYEPRREQVIQRYGVNGLIFAAGVWQEVSAEVAALLRPVHQHHTDPLSPLAFDVCSTEEAVALGMPQPETESSDSVPPAIGFSAQTPDKSFRRKS